MLAALVGALLLFAAPASAQTTLWSATLTVKNLGSGIGYGCWNGSATPSARCSTAATLSNDDFNHGGVDYHVSAIISSAGNLDVAFDKAIPQSLRTTATLNVGSNAYTLASASFSNSNKTMSWVGNSAEIPLLTLNSNVSLSLVLPQQMQTLSVEATPPCGSTVTDLSVQPSHVLVLDPAPAADTIVEFRWVAGDSAGPWGETGLPIRPSGRSDSVAHNPFADLRNLRPGFEGFEFRLQSDHSVMAECTWTLREGSVRTPPPLPPPPP
ncbi:MAG: hypothetical protein F4Z13_01590, partial [Candidatus Dadabacteria bacterium]|nr:hypothetical protein [Candidatus Dadabacteria bacterium]